MKRNHHLKDSIQLPTPRGFEYVFTIARLSYDWLDAFPCQKATAFPVAKNDCLSFLILEKAN